MGGGTILDDPAGYSTYDKHGGASLVSDLPRQLEEGYEMAPAGEPFGARAVAFFGLGGSGIVGKVAEALMASRAPLPVVVVRDFDAPAWVNADTLAVIVSYSGHTIETVAVARDVIARGARPFFISSGGRLLELAAGGGFPYARVPAGRPPRCSLGYMASALFAYLGRRGWVDYDPGAVASHLRNLWEEWGFDVPSPRNEAKQLALRIAAAPMAAIYGVGPLAGVAAERCRTQLAENAKYLASGHVFPELCHNELVAFEQPTVVASQLLVVVFRPAAEEPQARLQTDVALEFIAAKAGAVYQHRARGEGAAGLFEQVFFGDLVSYYLSLLRGVDAVPVASIAALKKRVSG